MPEDDADARIVEQLWDFKVVDAPHHLNCSVRPSSSIRPIIGTFGRPKKPAGDDDLEPHASIAQQSHGADDVKNPGMLG